jgi:hypothetical protein
VGHGEEAHSYSTPAGEPSPNASVDHSAVSLLSVASAIALALTPGTAIESEGRAGVISRCWWTRVM